MAQKKLQDENIGLASLKNIKIIGDIVPKVFYSKLTETKKKGAGVAGGYCNYTKANHSACAILAHIIWLYRKYEKDGVGNFENEKLKTSYSYFAEIFYTPLCEVKKAFILLNEKKIISSVLKNGTSEVTINLNIEMLFDWLNNEKHLEKAGSPHEQKPANQVSNDDGGNCKISQNNKKSDAQMIAGFSQTEHHLIAGSPIYIIQENLIQELNTDNNNYKGKFEVNMAKQKKEIPIFLQNEKKDLDFIKYLSNAITTEFNFLNFLDLVLKSQKKETQDVLFVYSEVFETNYDIFQICLNSIFSPNWDGDRNALRKSQNLPDFLTRLNALIQRSIVYYMQNNKCTTSQKNAKNLIFEKTQKNTNLKNTKEESKLETDFLQTQNNKFDYDSII